MATFVEFVPEEEQVSELSRFLAELLLKKSNKETSNALFEELTSLASSKNVEGFTAKLADNLPLAFAEATDLQSFFLTLGSFLDKSGSALQGKVLPKIISTITGTADDKSKLRLAALADLYNTIASNPVSRYSLFLSLFQFAKAANLPDLLQSQVSLVEARAKEWKLSTAQTRTLYKAVRELVRGANPSSISMQWTIQYLSTFSDADAADAAADAAQAIVDALRVPGSYQFDSLAELSAVRQLEKNKQFSKHWQLLSIFVQEGIEAYTSFQAANADLIKSAGLDNEELTRKIRLLSLATLAGTKTELPYKEIASAIKVSEDDVELWVVQAISEGVVELRIDQLSRVVIVSRALHRTFSKAQWKQVRDGLQTWKEHVHDILDKLEERQAQIERQIHAAGQNAVH